MEDDPSAEAGAPSGAPGPYAAETAEAASRAGVAARPAAARLVLGLAFALCAALLALLMALDLDISPQRFLRNDVLFRGADSIDTFYAYTTQDPSPFSVALPADLFVREQLRAGRLPLWDRMQGGGYSMLGQGNLGVFFPLRWLAALFPAPHMQAALMLMTLYLCFAGSFLWLRALRCSLSAASLGAGLFAGSGVMLGQLPFDGVAVFLFLPWLLLAWWRWRARRSLARFAVLVLLFALSFTSGHHMLLTCVFLAVGLVALCDFFTGPREPRALLGLAAAGVWGAACAALVLLPFIVHLSSAWAYKTETPQGLGYEVPDLAGWLESLRQLFVETDTSFLDAPGWYRSLGVPTVGLALLGAAACRARGLAFLAPALALAFALCLPGPWLGFLSDVPPLRYLRNLYLYVILVAMFTSAAAVGFDWLRERVGRRAPAALWPVAAALLVGLAFLRGVPFFEPIPLAAIPVSEAYQGLRGDPERMRITSLGGQSHLPNIAHLTGLEDLRVISVAHDARYHRWFELVDPHVLSRSFPTVRLTPELGSPLVGAFNVKYVLVGKLPHHVFLTQLRPGDPFGPWPAVPARGDELRLVYEDPRLQILQVGPSYRPRAFRPDEVHAVAPGAERAAAWLRAHGEALARGAVVVEAPTALHAALEASAPARHEIQLEYPSHTRVRLGIRAEAPGLLVLNDSFEAGWRATLDGVDVPILPVNLISRGVFVPAGRHEIAMRYQPPGLAPGAALSTSALAALGLALGWARWRNGARGAPVVPSGSSA